MEPREKAKQVLTAIVEASGGSFFGKTRLYKAFYFAQLNHLRDFERPLTDHPVVRLPHGPAVDEGNALLRELVDGGVLRQTQRRNGPFVEEVFTLLGLVPSLTEQERATIAKTVDWIGDRSATELSELTHENSNTWPDTPNGAEMNLYADLLSETEYADLLARQHETEELVDGAFAR